MHITDVSGRIIGEVDLVDNRQIVREITGKDPGAVGKFHVDSGYPGKVGPRRTRLNQVEALYVVIRGLFFRPHSGGEGAKEDVSGEDHERTGSKTLLRARYRDLRLVIGQTAVRRQC